MFNYSKNIWYESPDFKPKKLTPLQKVLRVRGASKSAEAKAEKYLKDKMYNVLPEKGKPETKGYFALLVKILLKSESIKNRSELVQFCFKSKYPELRFLAAFITKSQGILKVLAKDKDSRVRQGVACNVSTPTTVLHSFVKNPKELASVLFHVAGNRNTSSKDRKKLIKSSNSWVLTGLVYNPKLTNKERETLARLKGGKYRYVRVALAGHSKTPEYIRLKLYRDYYAIVRGNVAESAKMPILRKMFKTEKSWWVFAWMFRNKNLTKAFRKKIMNHPNDTIRKKLEEYVKGGMKHPYFPSMPRLKFPRGYYLGSPPGTQ